MGLKVNTDTPNKKRTRVSFEYFLKHKYRNPQDDVVKAYVSPKLRFIYDHISLAANASILDVGCGNGTFTHYFGEKYKNTYCMDASMFQLRDNSCKKRICGDAYNLPFADSSFDIVFSANLLHHLDEPLRGMEEMKRVSRKFLVFVEPNIYYPPMLIFSLLVKAERGTLNSCMKRWKNMAKNLNLKIIGSSITGMITQQNTPSFLVPLLKYFDKNFIFGAYCVIVCEIQDKKVS